MGRGGRTDKSILGNIGNRRSKKTAADYSWKKGYDALASGNQAGAEDAWLQATREDPGMADAWLGLHALKPSSFYYLNQVYNNVSRLGESYNKFGAGVHSHYAPIWFHDTDLSSSDDVFRAMARELSSREKVEEANYLLDQCKPGPRTTASRMRVAFNDQDYTKCVAIHQRTDWPEEYRIDANVITAISMSRLNMHKPAIDLLKSAVKEAPTRHISNASRYQLAMAYDKAGKTSLSRQELELVAADDISFLDVADRLGLNGPPPGQSSDSSQDPANGPSPEPDAPDEDRPGVKNNSATPGIAGNGWSSSQQQAAEDAGLQGIDFTRLASEDN